MTASQRIRVVVDTNVIISGALFGGMPKKVLDVVQSGNVEVLMSRILKNEIIRQLQRFQVPEITYRVIRSMISFRARMLLPKVISRTVRDPKDDMLLALSLTGKVDFLVTGDKDLLILRQFEETRIVTPRQFLHHVKQLENT